MKRGHPTLSDQIKIIQILQPYYEQGISAKVTSTKTKINVKTVLKYFHRWNKEILSENGDFFRRCNIEKEKSVKSIDYDIVALNQYEKEINSIRKVLLAKGDIAGFEKMQKLQLKIIELRQKATANKTNLIITPTVDNLMEMQENV